MKLSNKGDQRWAYVSKEKEEELTRKVIPKNTASATKWAVEMFITWKQSRNKCFSKEDQVPDLECTEDPEIVSKWLTLYVAEVRKQDRTKYPPKTMYSLLTGLLRYGREMNSSFPYFLDLSDQRFKSLHNAIDNVLHDLHQCGVGSDSKSADVFTKEEENQLWELGIPGINNPKSLLCTVFFSEW